MKINPDFKPPPDYKYDNFKASNFDSLISQVKN